MTLLDDCKLLAPDFTLTEGIHEKSGDPMVTANFTVNDKPHELRLIITDSSKLKEGEEALLTGCLKTMKRMQ